MNNKHILPVVVIALPLLFASCKKDYLKDAIQYEGVVCLYLYTENCRDTIFVHELVENLDREISKDTDITDIKKHIYSHVKDSVPLKVSKEFYLEHEKFPSVIQKDSLMQVIYDRYGVPGLLKNYFKIEESNYDLYVFWNDQERFVEEGQKPKPAFGVAQKLGYMSYLLSKHNIYMTFMDFEEIPHIIIYSNCSDMKAVEKYKEESKHIPFMRNPFED